MRRATRVLSWIIVLSSALIAVAGIVSRPAPPDGFYTFADTASSKPGTLFKHEPFDRKVPPGARAWRILYATTQAGGAPTVASAIVMTSAKASADARPVIAWTHGTTGIVPSCAPSLLDDPFRDVAALPELLAHDWIYVATDYAGQGTEGLNPYLVGEGEARSALDGVRAARQLNELHASDRTVVWGHSQGGHAAMWTGIVAPTYAPDVPIAGIAASAPATDLTGLIARVQFTTIGHIMTSYVLEAYSRAYNDVKFDDYASGWNGAAARAMASRCLDGPKALFSVFEAITVAGTIFKTSPTSGPMAARLKENSPVTSISQPLMIAQGSDDVLVYAEVQAEFVKSRCTAGQALEFYRFAGRDHATLVAPNSPLVDILVKWTRDRLTGALFAPGCREMNL